MTSSLITQEGSEQAWTLLPTIVLCSDVSSSFPASGVMLAAHLYGIMINVFPHVAIM